jgi:hypothetical protein
MFAEAVNTKLVPDYLQYIKQPMDFATMTQKLKDHRYANVQEFTVISFLFLKKIVQNLKERSKSYL